MGNQWNLYGCKICGENIIMANLGSILSQYEKKYEQAQAANLKRYEQAMSIYDEVISRYQPGGAFERAALQQLGTQKTRETGAEMHQMIGAGLYGTTGMPAIGRRWEESVGAPARLRLEDIQMQRLSQAQIGKAGFMERVEDVGPDLGMMASLMGQAGTYQQPTTTRTYGRTFGASSFAESGLLYPTAGAAGRLTGGIGGTYQQPAATTGTIWGSGTKEATMAERERRRQAAATVSPEAKALSKAGTYSQAQAAVGGKKTLQQTIAATPGARLRPGYEFFLTPSGVLGQKPKGT